MSVISAIRQRFSIGQQHSSAFSSQQNAASKISASRGSGGDMDEVSYAGLNDKDAGYDLQMMQDSLDYEAYSLMAESDRNSDNDNR